jgi:hypothetical protein
MTKRSRPLWGSGAGAITPASLPTPPAPIIRPDLHVESYLFAAYLAEKQRADNLQKRVIDMERRFKQWKAKGLAKKLSYGMKPAHKENA